LCCHQPRSARQVAAAGAAWWFALLLLRGGRVLARKTGIMDALRIVAWVEVEPRQRGVRGKSEYWFEIEGRNEH
jgi:hypothetical protein